MMGLFKGLLPALAVLSPLAMGAVKFDLRRMYEPPVEQRVQLFKSLGDQGARLLSITAFDQGSSLQLRWRAITTMGRWDARRFRPELSQALKSREWFIRNAALIAMQTDERDRAVQESIRLLTDPALVVRTQAVRNVIALEAREAEPQLWSEIFAARNFRSGESLWVRCHMAEALARFANPSRTKSFQRLLLDPDARLHKWAILGLENASGYKMTDPREPLEVRRQKWLSRLGVEEI